MRTKHAEFITSQTGKKKAVIPPIRVYEQLLEDLHDLAVIAERHDEYPISLDEMKKRLADHAPV